MPIDPAEGNASPDMDDRIRDFWDRHGGPGSHQSQAGDTVHGVSGWSEVYAADGYTLRCEWAQVGDRHSMKFVETPPQT